MGDIIPIILSPRVRRVQGKWGNGADQGGNSSILRLVKGYKNNIRMAYFYRLRFKAKF